MFRMFLGTLLVTLATAAQAQGPVRESEFLSVLQSDHPALMSLREGVGRARAERSRAALLANPTASFEREAPGSVEQTTWQIAWTPPLDGRRGAATRAAEAGLRAATSQLAFDGLALRSELRRAFAEWAISAERSQVVEAHLVLVRRLATQMESRASRGEESGLAARRLALAALEVEAEAARASAAAVQAKDLAFALHRGLPPGARPERPQLPHVLDSLRITGRSDLAARRSDVEQAEWQLRHGGRFLRFPEIAFGWQQIQDDSFSDEGPLLGVTWPLPLFDRQQPERIEASSRLAAARGRLELATSRAEAQLSATRAAYERLREPALRGMQTVAESEGTVESAMATFRLGESRLTDLLETLRSILSARLAALDLYAAALEAHRNLELAAGRPLITEER